MSHLAIEQCWSQILWPLARHQPKLKAPTQWCACLLPPPPVYVGTMTEVALNNAAAGIEPVTSNAVFTMPHMLDRLKLTACTFNRIEPVCQQCWSSQVRTRKFKRLQITGNLRWTKPSDAKVLCGGIPTSNEVQTPPKEAFCNHGGRATNLVKSDPGTFS